MQIITRRRVRLLGAGDEGVALVTVVGVMVLVTLLSVGAFTLAQQSLFDAKRAEAESRAFRVAAAGLDYALAEFENPNTAVLNEPLSISTVEGTATVTTTKTDGDAGEYEVVSTGRGIDGSIEQVTQKFYFFNLWEMNFAGTGSQSLMSGSSGMNGSSNIYGPFYVRGNLSLDANFTVRDGPLFVNDGKLTVTSATTEIGTLEKKVRIYCNGDVDLTKGKPALMNYDGPFLSVPNIELPTLSAQDMAKYATLAQDESTDNKMSRVNADEPELLNLETFSWEDATYKFFGDAAQTVSPLGQGVTPLVLGTPCTKSGNKGLGTFGSWGEISRVTTDGVSVNIPASADGLYTAEYTNSHDDFAYWDNPLGTFMPAAALGSNSAFTPGWDLLFISGTVYVDGPLVFNDNVLYIGNGTIVANGPVKIKGVLRPYWRDNTPGVVNKVGEDLKWCLGIVTPSPIDMYASGSNNGVEPVRNNAFDYAGAFYTDNVLTVYQPSTSVRGSILSRKMELLGTNGDIVTNPLLPTYLPDSLPGGGSGVLTLGLWSRSDDPI